MTAKDLLRSLKSSIERESCFSEDHAVVELQISEETSKAVIAIPVEGKVRLFEVFAKDLGVTELRL